MKFCVICWEEVHADGCGFYCKNCNHLQSKDEINWLGPFMVFDREKIDFVEKVPEPGVGYKIEQ